MPFYSVETRGEFSNHLEEDLKKLNQLVRLFEALNLREDE
jgi:hypothetical protein